LAVAVSLGVGLPAHAQSSSRKVAPVQAGAAAEEPLTPAELAIAANVHVGSLPCELGQTVTIDADAQTPGYFLLQLKNQRFRVRPVETTTGAVRLEDRLQGAVWLQLSNKSMLMSQKLGRRLADECRSPLQQVVAEQLKLNPAPSLLDVAQSPSR
jgi:hypothetical protein